MGTPVSQSLNIVAGSQGDAMRHATQVIDRLHGDGALPYLFVDRAVLDDRLAGQCCFDESVIYIQKNCRIAEFVFIHEIGHDLDRYGFTPGRDESRYGHEFVHIIDAIRASEAHDSLASLQNTSQGTLLSEVQYLLKDSECWARAYSQWVTIQTGDERLMAQLSTLRQDPVLRLYPYQWEDADFDRIGKEITLLMRRKGWVR